MSASVAAMVVSSLALNASPLEVFGMHYTGVASAHRRVQRSNAMFSNANGAFRRDLWETEHFDEHVAGAEDLAWTRIMLRRGYEWSSSRVHAPIIHTASRLDSMCGNSARSANRRAALCSVHKQGGTRAP